MTNNTVRNISVSHTALLTLLLWLLTLVAQLSDIWWGQDRLFNEKVNMLLPSVIMLSIVSLPAIIIGLKLLPSIYAEHQLPNKSIASWLFLHGNKRECLYYSLIGAVVLGLILIGTVSLIRSLVDTDLPELGHRGVLRGILVSFGAAIAEEVWFRLGMTSIMVALIMHLRKQTSASDGTWWLSIVLPGLLFGLIHIPQVVNHDALSTLTFTTTMLGNMITSTYFGWCFWRFGLMAAMVAHFVSDIMLHVVTAAM